MTPIDLVLSQLPHARRNGSGWRCPCPCHDGKSDDSLSIDTGEDGRVLLRCFAGCITEDILARLGLQERDLSADNERSGKASCKPASKPQPRPPRPVKSPTVYTTPMAATRAWEVKLGKPCTAAWEYRNDAGEPVGATLRFPPAPHSNERKRIRPIARRGDGWTLEGMDAPRCLYRLEELINTTGRVYVTEGEKTCEAARSLGLTATTSAGGANAAAKANWSPLAGREAVILPDAGAPGRTYAKAVTDILHRLFPTAQVRVVELPGLGEGEDIVEFIANHDSTDDDSLRERVNNLADEAAIVEPAVPDRVSRATWRSFPTSALPEPVRSFVSESAQAIGCDASFTALPLLSSLRSGASAHRQALERLHRGAAG